ncbi:MAG: hypothetical protein ABIH46_06530, partial [Chloroflexota bacterium]
MDAEIAERILGWPGSRAEMLYPGQYVTEQGQSFGMKTPVYFSTPEMHDAHLWRAVKLVTDKWGRAKPPAIPRLGNWAISLDKFFDNRPYHIRACKYLPAQ